MKLTEVQNILTRQTVRGLPNQESPIDLLYWKPDRVKKLNLPAATPSPRAPEALLQKHSWVFHRNSHLFLQNSMMWTDALSGYFVVRDIKIVLEEQYVVPIDWRLYRTTTEPDTAAAYLVSIQLIPHMISRWDAGYMNMHHWQQRWPNMYLPVSLSNERLLFWYSMAAQYETDTDITVHISAEERMPITR